jgi:hypothetical protein
MEKRILYKHDSGIAVIIPTGELSAEETAKKDVPTGLPYKIVDVSEIPADRTFRNAWDIDEAELTDGVGE